MKLEPNSFSCTAPDGQVFEIKKHSTNHWYIKKGELFYCGTQLMACNPTMAQLYTLDDAKKIVTALSTPKAYAVERLHAPGVYENHDCIRSNGDFDIEFMNRPFTVQHRMGRSKTDLFFDMPKVVLKKDSVQRLVNNLTAWLNTSSLKVD